MKRRRLGQHYLTDPEAVRRVVSMARISPGERVLEIGTGRGVLTKELVGLGESLEAYELDGENYNETLRVLGKARARVRLGDAFDHRPRFDVLVSSLPYSESARFVEWISGIRYSRAVVVLQEDFVTKLTAPPGSRDYRAVSALAQVSSDIRVISKVGRDSFSPQPKVSSVIAAFAPILRVSRQEVASIYRLFSLRRREVASALSELEMDDRGLSFGRRRVNSLIPQEVHFLCSP